MSLKDEIFRALTGGAPGRESFGGMLYAIRQRYPSRRAMAKGTGIPETTLRRWDTNGIGPKAQEARLPQLQDAYRRSLANPAVLDRWKNNGMTIHLSNVRGSRGRRQDRPLTARNLDLKADTGKNVVAAFLAGDDQGAARAFRAGIQDEFYKDTMFGEWMDDDLGYEGEMADDDYLVSVGGAS